MKRGRYRIGDANTGVITVSQAVNPANVTSQVRVGAAGSGTVNLNADFFTSNNSALSVTPNVVVGGTPAVNTGSGSITFSGTVNGDGTAGRTLNTTNIGATTFTGAVGGTNPLASLSVTTATLSAGAVATAAGLSVTNSGAGSITGAVTDTGGLTKGGAGTLTLTGINTYSGATRVDGGTLEAGAANTFSPNSAVTLAAGTTLNVFNFSNVIGSLAGGGSVVLSGGTLTTGGDDASTSFGGAVSGPAGQLVKQGAGTFTLTGTNTFNGLTTVAAGRLNVNGSVGAVTVAAGGTLGGGGTIAGNVTGAGTVAPGASPGRLTINGDFTPTGAVEFEVNPPAADAGIDFDQLVVNGAVDLSGATLEFSRAAGAVAAGRIARLIDNDGTDGITPAAGNAPASAVVINGNTYRLFYTGGTGNDLALAAADGPATVYVDDSFTQPGGQPIADADLGTAGDQPAVVGVTAFTTIADALAAVAAGGTVVINSGTYAEAVSLPAGVTLRVTGPDAAGDVTVNSLAAAATSVVQLDGTSLLTVGDDTDTTVAGAIIGSGGRLTKTGTGTLTLSGANTYGGATAVASGVLLVDGTGSGTGPVTVNSGGTLVRARC